MNNHLFIDLRDKQDYLAGHIPGALHMSLEDITREATDPQTPIALYC
ncbi:MAG: rhodanese-like domain-containing protein [Clostridia bacterium]|nr:rhodanese-like domain-containing protein [Clostridia bacterium]